MASIGGKITLLFVLFIIYYSLNQIFSFYGVSSDVYDVYYFFYAFLIISFFILPDDPPTF
jgi:hypothetical protein